MVAIALCIQHRGVGSLPKGADHAQVPHEGSAKGFGWVREADTVGHFRM